LPPCQQVTFLGRCLTASRWRFLPSGFNETACQTLLTVILEADTHTNRLANAARGLCRSVLPEGRATLRRRCPCLPFASQPLEAKSVGLFIVCPLPKEGWLLTSLLSGFWPGSNAGNNSAPNERPKLPFTAPWRSVTGPR